MLKLMEIGASRLESAQKPGRAESDFLSVQTKILRDFAEFASAHTKS